MYCSLIKARARELSAGQKDQGQAANMVTGPRLGLASVGWGLAVLALFRKPCVLQPVPVPSCAWW